MGFRFRKSFKVLPGVRINLSKSGASATFGKAGAVVNVSDKGIRETVGVPGTGISYSEPISTGSASSRPGGIVLLVVLLLIFLFVAALR